MNKDLRILFIGTPLFAVTSLKKLVEENYNVVAAITVWDKPAGRGQKTRCSEVKEYAVEKNIPVLQPKNLKNLNFIEEVKALNVDLIVVVAFRMLPQILWEIPRYGTFNLHTSLLPEYRGSAPINWVIINGEKETGVSTFFINNEIDAGELMLRRCIPIGPEETFGELYIKMMHVGAEVLRDTIDLIASGEIKTIRQPKGTKLAPKLFIQNCEVDWTKSIDDVFNFIRGLNPHPTARTSIIDGNNKIDIKIYDISKEYENHNKNIRDIIVTKKEMKVVVKGGYIVMKKIQAAGKKQMDTTSFLNGYNFTDENPFVCNVFMSEGYENCTRSNIS